MANESIGALNRSSLMITLLLIFVAIWLAGLVMLVVGLCCAPEGHQDSQGFHFGEEGAPVALVATAAVAVNDSRSPRLREQAA